MATRNDRLSRDARMLLTRLEHQHASASPAKWEQLREETFSATHTMAARFATPAAAEQVQVLAEEFDATRDRALAKRRVVLVRESLRAGQATSAGVSGLFESFDVPCGDGQVLPMLAPATGQEPGSQLARRAALSGRCTKCGALATVANDEVVVEHKRRCVAAAFTAA